jgi:hypothetical protein
MKDQPVIRDERSTAIENASYRVAYMVMSYGALAIVAYRGFVLQQSSWDLLALVVLGGAVATIYQGRNKVLSRYWVMATFAAVILAGVLALVFALLRR